MMGSRGGVFTSRSIFVLSCPLALSWDGMGWGEMDWGEGLGTLGFCGGLALALAFVWGGGEKGGKEGKREGER